jgi:hypothetical protein
MLCGTVYIVKAVLHEALPNCARLTAQVTASKSDTLLDRWIVDPGSNVHICNSTYFNWVKTSDAKPTDVIFAGATAHQVAA